MSDHEQFARARRALATDCGFTRERPPPRDCVDYNKLRDYALGTLRDVIDAPELLGACRGDLGRVIDQVARVSRGFPSMSTSQELELPFNRIISLTNAPAVFPGATAGPVEMPIDSVGIVVGFHVGIEGDQAQRGNLKWALQRDNEWNVAGNGIVETGYAPLTIFSENRPWQPCLWFISRKTIFKWKFSATLLPPGELTPIASMAFLDINAIVA